MIDHADISQLQIADVSPSSVYRKQTYPGGASEDKKWLVNFVNAMECFYHPGLSRTINAKSCFSLLIHCIKFSKYWMNVLILLLGWIVQIKSNKLKTSHYCIFFNQDNNPEYWQKIRSPNSKSTFFNGHFSPHT